MFARFTRFLTFTAAAALAVASCSRDNPTQPLRPNHDVVTQDSGGPPPPPNDNRDSARFIPFVPYSDTVDVTNATVEPGEAVSTCHENLGLPARTVWYMYQANVSRQLTAELFGPGPGILSAYVVHADTLIPIGCNSNFGPVTFSADSGSLFLFQISDSAGANAYTVFDLQSADTIIQPPPVGNDNFADARMVPSVPYSDTADFSFASLEAGEPFGCTFQSRSVWYVFQPSETRAVQASLQFNGNFTSFAVWTGTSLGNLSLVRCGFYYNPQTFTAFAGTTYYIQVLSDAPAPVIFSLQPPPPPQANFYTNPPDPSTFDQIQFVDQSYDPAGIGIQSQQWSFGDGATATGFQVAHRYAADGDYQVTLTVRTYDGRTASTTRTLQVRTRDVAITKFVVPNAASSGQTRSITVGVNSNRASEVVVVSLYKSIPGFGGYQLIGQLVQTVPPRSANRTTNFNFSYTFTADDAAIGKVTFRAVATIQGGRDALPADNEAIADPTKVGR